MDAVNAAAVTGDLPLLKEMASTVDLRRLRGFKGRSLLHLAVEGSCVMGRLKVCRFLVEEKGFDANSTSTEGETPIFVATNTDCRLLNGADGVVPLLTYFLGRGGDPAAPDARGCTPLHNAAQYGHVDAVRLLLSKGVPVDPFNHHGTPSHLAAGNTHDQVLKILLEHGADPNKLILQVSPLIMACAGASIKCIKLLLEAGANVNFHSSPGPTMLLAAVGAGSADVVNFLLEIGADPNVHDGYRKFPIILAAANGRRKHVEILLPRTNPIPSMPDWSVDGIINTMKNLPREMVLEPIDNAKSQGKEAFAKGDYVNAMDCYKRATAIDPRDATSFANLSLCYLKLREGERAVLSARQCQKLHPRWAKAWYREGAGLSLLQHGAAVPAFEEALKLDPESDEIKVALREAKDALRIALRNVGENP